MSEPESELSYGTNEPASDKNVIETIPKEYTYNNLPFHKIFPNIGLFSGDFEKKNGSGGASIYGEFFEDENFDILPSSGVVQMVER